MPSGSAHCRPWPGAAVRPPPARAPPGEEPRRQHAARRADRLPRDPHVGAALPGRDDARRGHGGRGACLEPLALDLERRGLVRGRRCYTLAEAKLALGYDPGVRSRRSATRTARAASSPSAEIAVLHSGLGACASASSDEMFSSALARPPGGRRSSSPLFLAWFWIRGATARPDERRIRGAELVSAGPSFAAACSRSLGAPPGTRSRARTMRARTAWPASRIRCGPRPSTPSSRAPPARARRCSSPISSPRSARSGERCVLYDKMGSVHPRLLRPRAATC